MSSLASALAIEHLDDKCDNDPKLLSPVMVTLSDLNPKLTVKASTSHAAETGLDSHSKRVASSESIASNQSIVLQCQQMSGTNTAETDRCIPLPLYTNIDSSKSQSKAVTNTSGPTLAFIRLVLTISLLVES